MGKASRRKKDEPRRSAAKVPFVARPFEGLPNEQAWVALKEFVPSGIGTVTTTIEGEEREVDVVALLPASWPALHRADGRLLVALQNQGGSSDASRDLAQALLAAAAAPAGTPVTGLTPATAETPRLQDLIAEDAEFTPEIKDTFDYWIPESELTDESREQLAQADSAIIPNGAVGDLPNVYWCELGGRTYLRWVLTEDEDVARDAIARLWAAGEHTPGEGSVFLGAFRAMGLLIPVLEIPVTEDPAERAEAMAALITRYEQALTVKTPLSSEEKRVREAMSSRQITLR